MPRLAIGPIPEMTGPEQASDSTQTGVPHPSEPAALSGAVVGENVLASAGLAVERSGLQAGVPPLGAPQRDEQTLAFFGRQQRPREVVDAENTLSAHHLRGSFTSHFELQLEQGRIRIGVIDDFGPDTTHGRNVERRILEQMPRELRGVVEIVRYDVAGLDDRGRAEVIAQAARDAQNKELLALSVSGGISAYPVTNIERLIGGRDLTKDTAREAYDALIRNNGTSPELQTAMRELNVATGKIPVVTPVWNNDTTTLPALLLGSHSSNGIITSIDRRANLPIGPRFYNATQIDELVDVTVPPQFPNPNTSQSAPFFIGNLLRYGLEQYHQNSGR